MTPLWETGDRALVALASERAAAQTERKGDHRVQKHPTGGLVTLAPSAFADDLPLAIDYYHTTINAQDIDAYLACFTDDAVMIDVRREFVGQDAIRT